jgi:hypothetical protein
MRNVSLVSRWAFIKVTDPWDAKNTIREALKRACVESVGVEDLC